MKDSLVVELKALRGKYVEVEHFLRSELHGRVGRGASRLVIEGEKPKDVKLKLGKFLHAHNLTSYRVRTRDGTIEVVHLQEMSTHRQVSGMPSRRETTPEYFPGLSAFAASRFKTPHGYFGPKTLGNVRRKGLTRKR